MEMIGIVGMANMMLYTFDFGQIVTLLENLYSGLLTLVTPIAVIACLICAFIIIFSSDPGGVKQAKSWLIRVAIGIIIAHGAKYLVKVITDAAKNWGG